MGLQRLAAEDPSFRVETRPRKSVQTIMKGMGELHLDILDRPPEARVQGRGQHRCAAGGLSRDHLATRSSTPTPTRSSRVVRVSSPEVKMIITPTEPGEGYSFESRIVGGSVPKEYIPGCRKGHRVGYGLRSAGRLPGHRLQGRA